MAHSTSGQHKKPPHQMKAQNCQIGARCSAALNRQNDHRLVSADSPALLQLIYGLAPARRIQLHSSRRIGRRRRSLNPIPHSIIIFGHSLSIFNVPNFKNVRTKLHHFIKICKLLSLNYVTSAPIDSYSALCQIYKRKHTSEGDS